MRQSNDAIVIDLCPIFESFFFSLCFCHFFLSSTVWLEVFLSSKKKKKFEKKSVYRATRNEIIEWGNKNWPDQIMTNELNYATMNSIFDEDFWMNKFDQAAGTFSWTFFLMFLLADCLVPVSICILGFFSLPLSLSSFIAFSCCLHLPITRIFNCLFFNSRFFCVGFFFSSFLRSLFMRAGRLIVRPLPNTICISTVTALLTKKTHRWEFSLIQIFYAIMCDLISQKKTENLKKKILGFGQRWSTKPPAAIKRHQMLRTNNSARKKALNVQFSFNSSLCVEIFTWDWTWM